MSIENSIYTYLIIFISGLSVAIVDSQRAQLVTLSHSFFGIWRTQKDPKASNRQNHRSCLLAYLVRPQIGQNGSPGSPGSPRNPGSPCDLLGCFTHHLIITQTDWNIRCHACFNGTIGDSHNGFWLGGLGGGFPAQSWTVCGINGTKNLSIYSSSSKRVYVECMCVAVIHPVKEGQVCFVPPFHDHQPAPDFTWFRCHNDNGTSDMKLATVLTGCSSTWVSSERVCALVPRSCGNGLVHSSQTDYFKQWNIFFKINWTRPSPDTKTFLEHSFSNYRDFVDDPTNWSTAVRIT